MQYSAPHTPSYQHPYYRSYQPPPSIVAGWRISLLSIVLLVSGAVSPNISYAQTTGYVEIDFLEEETEEPLVCRVEILDSQAKPLRARGSLNQSGWNLVEQTLKFKGRPGDYRYRVFHGPQFSAGGGGFTLDRKTQGYDVLRLARHANLREEGWSGGDLLSRVAAAQTLRWLPAEDLAMAVVPTDTFSPEPDSNLEPLWQGERWVEQKSFYDARAGSGLVLHHWLPPAAVPESLPSSRLLVMAKQSTASAAAQVQPVVHAEIAKLWARDTPVWLASGLIDSIQVLGEHATYDGSGAARFKPMVDPDPGRFIGPRGPARLIEYIYWQTLEAGLKIPPSAGSGFGQGPSPLGYNRVYTSTASVSNSQWWTALRQGQSFITNGPLLRVEINGQRPGATFRAAQGDTIELEVAVKLTVADPVEYLEVIFNGEKIYQARLDEYARQGGKIPPLKIEESGWIIVRVLTERSETYRMAMTAPFYCEVGEQPRVSEQAVAFFQSWLDASAESILGSEQAASNPQLPYIDAARKFWAEQASLANRP